ncbi:hypothetical protein Glove_202g67 [Diversispora epigaea]|uniref:sterol 3beta-glucosyltransferase n=1 Tax=Diversispora epigaea TaxID=1348612 RepID=A0A397IMX1_9GLOM|nr:hypothetical protein Glove_202g67 [Diversispora epigaea]
MFNNILVSAINAWNSTEMGATLDDSEQEGSESQVKSQVENQVESQEEDAGSNPEKIAKAESSLDAIYLTNLIQECKQGNEDCNEEFIRNKENLLKEKNVNEKLQEIFKLPKPPKQLIGEFRCTLIRSIMLHGIMFLTDDSICFHAYFPSEQDVILKEGYLYKKSYYKPVYDRYYFSLQNDILTYCLDSTDMYCPLEIIDLKYVLKVELKKNNFEIVTPNQTYKFQTDSDIIAEEWVTQLERSAVRAKYDGGNAKITIPIESINDINSNLSSNFPNTIQIKILDPEDPSSCEEYFFAFFSDSQLLYKKLTELWNKNKSDLVHSRDLTNLEDNSSKTNIKTETSRPLTSIMETIKYAGEGLKKSITIHKRSKSNNDSTRQLDQKISSTIEQQDSGTQATTSMTRKLTQRVSILLKYPSKLISSGPKESPTEETSARFRQYFALKNEQLHAVFHGYYLRMIPILGKFYISDNYVCFKSRVIGMTTNIMLPISNIFLLKTQKATMLGYYGLDVLTKTQQEMFFEFGSKDIRDRFVEMVELRMNVSIKDKKFSLSGESQVLIQQAIVKDQLLLKRLSISNVTSKISNFGEIISKPEKSMHITCLTIGSRGDVQPYIALAKGLMKEGHKVKIATHGEYEEWIKGHGIEFGYVGGNPAELMRICVENGMFTFGFFREARSNFRDWLDDLLLTSWDACKGTDLIIESPSAMAGIHISEALDIPYYRAFTMPWTRTRTYPHAFAVPDHDLKAPYNYSSYVLIENAFWLAIAPQINRWRKNTLNLKSTNTEKMDPSTVPFLYNFSKYIVPKASDWSDWVSVTGYWFLDNPDIGWKAPNDLLEFIESNHMRNKKIVYIGFGSIVVDDPKALTKTIIDAVEKSNVAAILSKGWSDRLLKTKDTNNEEEKEEIKEIKESYSNIYLMDSVPHDWLFQRIDAVVHHGGAGTTAAGLRAGIPTIIKPFFGDQFFWGERIENMKIGFCIKKLTVEKLAECLKLVTTDLKMIEKSKLVGENIRKEEGVGTAIQEIYKHLDHARQRIKSQRERTAMDYSLLSSMGTGIYLKKNKSKLDSQMIMGERLNASEL